MIFAACKEIKSMRHFATEVDPQIHFFIKLTYWRK